MEKKIANKILVPVLFLLVCTMMTVYAENCDITRNPKIRIEPALVLYEDQVFYYDMDIENNNFDSVIFSYALVQSSLRNFRMNSSTGEINFTPTDKDIGKHKLMFLAVNEFDCFDSVLVSVNVFDKPKITEYYPGSAEVFVDEGSFMRFTVNVTSAIEKNNVYSYRWYVDGIEKAISKEIVYSPGFEDSGSHGITVNVTDKNGLWSEQEWDVIVRNVNRPPALKYNLPDIVLSPYQEIELYNLNDYFDELDNDKLMFTYFFTDNRPSNFSLYYDVDVNAAGDVSFTSKTNDTAAASIVFVATDPYSMNRTSNEFKIKVLQNQDINEFFNLGKKKDCEVSVNCTEWSNCLPTGIKFRECIDINSCNDGDKVMENAECDFNATCFDSLKNQGEEGVDCGGICKPCPGCSDGILNQGEEGIDCGGPCFPCPNCNDDIQNQDETDTDCGGKVCTPCGTGRGCTRHDDCSSFNCLDTICIEPTCNDYKMNQGEERVDCGGPCEPCPTCVDMIQNQREEDVDCGGPCVSCETCFDGIKNQGETGKDCGGPCKKCIGQGILKILGIILGVLITFLIVRFVIFGSKKVLSKNKMDLFVALNEKMPRLFGKGTEKGKEIGEKVLKRLHELKSSIPFRYSDDELSKEFKEIMNDFLREISGVDGEFTRGTLKNSLKSKYNNPFLVNIIVILSDKTKISSEKKMMFKLELAYNIDEIISVLEKIEDKL
ncbi:MAG: hypothetical protein KKF44_04845 [Nanoarchaeota archaeon]|nr:hypothetical protein [Nanoarchaeota archaeon]